MFYWQKGNKGKETPSQLLWKPAVPISSLEPDERYGKDHHFI
jgi:hypothetical protein